MAELALHVAERLVRQLLLLAQRVGKAVHRLAALPALSLALPLTLLNLQVLHHPVELVQQGLGLGHAALVHQALDLVHHLLDLIGGDGLALLAAPVGAVGLILRLAFLRQHVGIGVGRLAQLVHQPLDLVGAGPVADRL